MDKVCVSDEALRKVANTLRDLEYQVSNISSNCIHKTTALLVELDDTFRKDVERYITEIDDLNNKITYFTSKNIDAMNERITKINEYMKLVFQRKIII